MNDERPTRLQLRFAHLGVQLGQKGDLSESLSSSFETRFPRAGLSEVSGSWGSGKTEWTLREMARSSSSLALAWVEECTGIYPLSFLQKGLSLSQVGFVLGKEESLDSALQLLRSQAFTHIVLRTLYAPEELALRRLQLAAEKSQCSFILLQEQPLQRGGWTFERRWQIQRRVSGGWEVRSVQGGAQPALSLQFQKA